MVQLGGRCYIILSLSLVSHETGKVKKICLNENYSRVQLGKNLSDMFNIRNALEKGDNLSPLLFNSL